MHLMRKKMLIVSMLIMSVLGCETVRTTQGGAVGVDREQRMSVSAQAIEQSASKQYATLMNDARKKGKLNPDPVEYDRVKKISDKLIKQVPTFRPDALNWRWEVNVLSSDEVNAWCMPGGKIAVYTGLINKLKINTHVLSIKKMSEMFQNKRFPSTRIVKTSF